MKVCLDCKARFPSERQACPGCGKEPVRIAGLAAYAPEQAESGRGFNPAYYSELAGLEAANFWFRSRNRLIAWAVSKYFPDAARLLEIGCGTGFVLAGIHRAIPRLDLSGSEIHSEGLAFAADRLPTGHFFQMDARRIPFEEEFDVVAAFDVLEHVQDDRSVLREMWQATRPGGGLLLTVPQHRWLWSRQDEYARHQRRYDAGDLKKKVSSAGFRILRSSSFVSLLLPLMLAVRWRKRQPVASDDALAELRISGWLNSFLERTLDLEGVLIRGGVSFPAGGSLLLAARKS